MTEHAMTVRPELEDGAGAIVVRPAMGVAEAIGLLEQMREFRKKVLKEGLDYGSIPGVAKPTLFKPGAEKLANIFALSVQHEEIEKVEDWEKGFFSYKYRAVVRSLRTGQVIADCIGSCNSLEDKYRYRQVPVWEATEEDKQAAVKVRTRKKRDGRGTYQVYYLPNAEPFSLVNTLQKMAQKRAMIGAILIATRASEDYTQDVEDMGEQADATDAAPAAPAGVDPETGEIRAPAAVEPLPDEITSTTPWPHEGKLKGVPLKDWPLAMLKWAIVPGRKLGDRSDEWQQAAKEELERRAGAPKPTV